MKKIIIKERIIYYFIPAAVILGAIAVYPLINNLILGFTTPSGSFTAENYKRLFADRYFWNALKNSLKWLLITVTAEFCVGLLMAVLMNMKLKGTKIFRTIYMIPWMMPIIAVCAVWQWMYNVDFGIISYLSNSLFGTKQMFLGSPSAAIFWLALIYVWKRSSFVMLMYLSGLQSISDDVYEACMLDGAGWFRQLFSITIPLLFPVIRSLMLISIISSLNQFTLVYSITKGGPARSTELIQMYVYKVGIEGYEFNYGASASTAFLIVVLIIALMYISLTEKAEEETY